MATYKIVRFFLSEEMGEKVIDRGMTLEEAQAHCRSTESSSRTARSAEAKARTRKYGAWFDAYREEG